MSDERLLAQALRAILPRPTQGALLARDGSGDFSSTQFRKLHDAGLIDGSYHLTDKGRALRDALKGPRP